MSLSMAESMIGRLTTWPAIKEFMFAGNATFTLRSVKTGMRYTYKVRVSKQDLVDSVKKADPAYFVNLLRGPDNENDFAYVGVLRKDMALRMTTASRMTRTAPAVQGLVWFLEKMRLERDVLGDFMPMLVEFWRSGHCGRCGRTLTVPSSVSRGMGDDCAGRNL